MRTHTALRITRAIIVLGLAIIIAGCGAVLPGQPGQPGSLSGRTTLTSTSLAGNSQSALPKPNAVTTDLGLEITPDNVTGEVLSLLFATADMEDEGLVIFGNERPDIALVDSDLYEFDLAAPEPITSNILLKSGFVGGPSNHMVLLFGYMDMYLTISGQEYVVRIALADVDDMQRGDKLLLDEATGDFRWYDLDAESFTTTRPSNPAAIAEVRDFTDPIRPNLVFYPVNALLLETVQLDAADLAAASGLDVVLDFVMTNAVVLVDENDSTSVTEASLITDLDLSQNVSDYSETGFQVLAEMELTPA